MQIAYESAYRLIHPVPIAYGEAIAVAVLGLAVNLASAWLLRDTRMTMITVMRIPTGTIITTTTICARPMCM